MDHTILTLREYAACSCLNLVFPRAGLSTRPEMLRLKCDIAKFAHSLLQAIVIWNTRRQNDHARTPHPTAFSRFIRMQLASLVM